MGNLADCSTTGWLYLDPDQIRRELEAAFPGVRAWLGEYTGHWWALANDRLVEADTPRQLADRIREVPGVRRVISPQRPVFGRTQRPGMVIPARSRGTSRPTHARPKRRRRALFGGWR
ncbi:hypothetical protein LUW76_24590 [Actinomadura madurae]|uniref:hypothetical protein n=1 Tax=Actinomadura madurae TaxID=1993 RepID=UPI002026C303|nr:hypothetical protein [Actinomadura madurae]URM97275.1 hypothetical protein LUW76_24590 [Actinomadura madurae]URN08038.1 hypothetical protein LUW74_34855 [Actinomadura madurae]